MRDDIREIAVSDIHLGCIAHTSDPHAMGQVQAITDKDVTVKWFDNRLTNPDTYAIANLDGFGIKFYTTVE